jgi:HD-like signal output (HDOD) protein
MSDAGQGNEAAGSPAHASVPCPVKLAPELPIYRNEPKPIRLPSQRHTPETMSALPFITCAPPDVAGWVRCFEISSLPVLASTAETLEEWRANEDHVDAHLMAETIATDPLMTLKLLAHVAALRHSRGAVREGSDAETVTAALVMLGISPFFQAFGPQDSAEQWLADQPGAALQGFRQVLRRSNRAGQFALSFAVHRMDHDAAVIHEAALLHDFAELLLWLRAPALALDILERQVEEPTLRSVAVQHAVLNVELPALQHQLMLDWRLPALLVHITDGQAQRHSHVDAAQLRNVQLAVRVARHSAHGWDNPALPDDVAEIGTLLQLGPEPTQRLLLDIDSD